MRTQDAGPWQACTHLPSYISGFFDGEGCFSVAIAPRRSLKTGWEVRPSVSASQNADRSQVIEEIARFFGCGAIRPDPGDRTVKWESRSLHDLVEHVLPHFRVYRLRSGKQRDVEALDTVCAAMLDGRHLDVDGLSAIVSIVSTMNPSGRRRYDPDEILMDLETR